MTKDVRNELDRAITRAIQGGYLDQLRMLKDRRVTPHEFLDASRTNRLLALRPSPLLAPLVEQWLKESDLRESSRKRYAQSWKILFAGLPAQATLDSLGGSLWAELVAGRHVSASTLNRDRAALLAFHSWAKKEGYHPREIEIKRRKEEPLRSEILIPEQIAAVERVCRQDRWPFFWCLFETGARQGEVLNLRAQDISGTGNPVLAFRSQPGSKARGKDRYVPVTDDLATCLRTLAVVNGGRVFPYGRTTVREWWAEVCEAANITGVTLHGIRATFITLALDAGVPPTDVQKLVGHSGLAMTMRYYRNSAQSIEAADRARLAMGFGRQGRTDQVVAPSIRPSTGSLVLVPQAL